jgi:hypothetical protein
LTASATSADPTPDYELSELAGRSRTPHPLEPIRGARLASVTRRSGILRTRYTSWSPP